MEFCHLMCLVKVILSSFLLSGEVYTKGRSPMVCYKKLLCKFRIHKFRPKFDCNHLMLKAILVKAVVVAQLVERSLPTPELRDSNPVIGKIYIAHLGSTVLKG